MYIILSSRVFTLFIIHSKNTYYKTEEQKSYDKQKYSMLILVYITKNAEL